MNSNVIFNEKMYIEHLLQTYKADNIKLYRLSQLLAVYFYNRDGYTDKTQLALRVDTELKLFNLDGYYYERSYKMILNICRYVIKKHIQLKDAYMIDIYQDEIERIKQCGDIKHQKLLFTLYVLARWNNDSGWTSPQFSLTCIKECANITCSKRELNSLFYDLLHDGYITTFKKSNKFVYKLVYYNSDKSIPVAIRIDGFENIGNHFVINQVNTHIMCQMCGRLVKKTNNRIKYCKKCAKKKRVQINANYYQNHKRNS